MALNKQQLDENIAALKEQGASEKTIQEYLSMQKEVTPEVGGLKKAEKIVGSIFPGRKIGEALGGSIAAIGRVARGDIAGARNIAQAQPTPLEVGGDVLGTVASGVGFAGGGLVGGIGARILAGVGIGGAISGGEALSRGAEPKEAAKSAVGGAIVGAGLPVVGAGLRAIGRQIEQLPARFVNSALSRSKKEVLADISKDKVDDFAKFVIQKKKLGTANTLVNQSIDEVKKLSGDINEALDIAARKTGGKVTIGRDNVLDEVVQLPEAQGALLKRSDVRAIIERLAPQSKQLLQKPSLTLEEANKLRQLVDTTLGDRAFLGGQLSSDKAVLKSFATTLRNTVKNKAPEGTREVFAELSNEIRFRDGLLDRIAQRAGNQVLSFGDFIGGGLGGAFTAFGVNPFIGIPAGVATRRVLESVPFKISAARIIDALTKAAPTLEDLTPAQQIVILNLFSEIFSPEETENSNTSQTSREESPAQ